MNAALLQNAIQLRRAGRLAEAENVYREILRGEPKHFEALHALGILAYQKGQLEEAARLIGEALAAGPAAPDAYYNRACILLRLSRPRDALADFDAAIARKSNYLEAHVNRAAALTAMGRGEEALSSYDRALALKPDLADVRKSRADLSLALFRNQDAAAQYERYLQLKPKDAAAWYCRGMALQRLRRLTEALGCYDKALALQPRNAGMHNARADLLFEIERFEDAARDYEAVLASGEAYPAYVHGYLMLCKLHSCDWAGLEERQRKVVSETQAGQFTIDPLGLTLVSDSLAELRQCSDVWRRSKYPETPAPLWRGERYAHGRIRVAYISADLRMHATAFLMAGVFERHDRGRFETIALSSGADDRSPMRRRLQAAFGQFIDIRGKTDAEVAEAMRAMEIDIAVDLKGYTAEGRPGIFAFRPAPVQAHYLGYPGTMASAHYDYLIADPIVIPPEHRAFYSEKIAYLPDAYQCNDRNREVSARTPSRAELGLPENGFVFCCFNNDHKILPRMFDVWMRLLRAVEESVLWLLQDNESVVRNLRREAEARGVAGSRIVFAARTNPADHLARQKCADLFLDTLPYNAHTTASDALWVGLPLVTAAGSTFAGRVAASLLTSAGVPELATANLEDYEALALTLARDPARLAALKAKIAAARDTCALFDTARITRNLEALYLGMHERAQRGAAPESFAAAP